VIGGRSGGLGWWWHTPDDTLDKLDPALLARDARLYAATLFRLCAEPILPFNYAAAAAELDAFVADYQQLLGDRFGLDPARERTQALRQDAATLHDALERLRVRLADGDTAPANLAAINAALMALGRAIIPLNYTAAGPFGHDPALAMPPLPLLDAARQLATAPVGSDAAKFSAVALQRGLNQVVYGLDAALAAVGQARAVVGG
jgi:hypothetical protein